MEASSAAANDFQTSGASGEVAVEFLPDPTTLDGNNTDTKVIPRVMLKVPTSTLEIVKRDRHVAP